MIDILELLNKRIVETTDVNAWYAMRAAHKEIVELRKRIEQLENNAEPSIDKAVSLGLLD